MFGMFRVYFNTRIMHVFYLYSNGRNFFICCYVSVDFSSLYSFFYIHTPFLTIQGFQILMDYI
jgi:hypothetical protein